MSEVTARWVHGGAGSDQWTWDARLPNEELRRYQVDVEYRTHHAHITLLLVQEIGDSLDYEEMGTFDSVEDAQAEAEKMEA